MTHVDDRSPSQELKEPSNSGEFSHRLAYAAFFLWLLSLPFVGIAEYGRDGGMRGISILLVGCFSPLYANFAWFANIFFVYAFSQILEGRTATKSSILACLISLDTFRLSSLRPIVGDDVHPVYGYGWGVILWFMALSVILISAGMRSHELRVASKGKYSLSELLKPVGILWLLCVLGISSTLAIYDRIKGNDEERQKLSGLVFKRHEVCSVPEAQITQANEPFSGVLELSVADKENGGVSGLGVKDLLSWGVPVVRVSNSNYSLLPFGDSNLIFARPADNNPSAVLTVKDGGWESGEIDLTLYDLQERRLLFEKKWRREVGSEYAYYCPSYGVGAAGKQPEQLVTEALELKNGRVNDLGVPAYEWKKTQATLVAGFEPPVASNNSIAQKKLNETVEISSRHNSVNCPDGVRFLENGPKNDFELGLRKTPFVIGNQRYYGIPWLKSMCLDGNVYFYSSARGFNNQKLFHIHRRNLPDFQQIWTKTLVIEGVFPNADDDSIRIVSLKEDSNRLLIDLIDDLSGVSGRFQAELE
jgi:hypothetical protein